MEAVKTAFAREWMDALGPWTMGTHSAKRKQVFLNTSKRPEGAQMCITKGRKPVEKATDCVIPMTEHSGKGKTRDSLFPGLTREATIREPNTQDLYTNESAPVTLQGPADIIIDVHNLRCVHHQRWAGD